MVVIENDKDLERSRKRVVLLRGLLERTEASTLDASGLSQLRIVLGLQTGEELPELKDVVSTLRQKLFQVEQAVEHAESGVYTGK